MVVKRASLQTMAAVEAMDPVQSALEEMNGKLDQMIRLLDDQTQLQRLALLEEGHILRFYGPGGERIALSLPDAQDDYLQRLILRNRNFHEAKLLAAVGGLGIVGPDSVVCDIGANIGNHSIYFGKVMRAGKVLACEPQSYCCAALTKNIALNGLQDRVVVQNCLIGAATGKGAMTRFNPRNLGAAAFAAKEDGDIPVFALDDVVDPADQARVDLIRINVEGMDLAVLQGAEAIITARHPAIWVELPPRETTYDSVRQHLERFGYRPYQLGMNDVLFRA